MQSCATSSHTDYACNSGTVGLNAWQAPSPASPGGDPSFFDSLSPKPATPACDGVIGCLSTFSMGSITDGASNTYLVGEKYLNPDHYLDGVEGTDNNCCYGGEDWDWHRWCIVTKNVPSSPAQDTPGLDDYVDFGSAHPSGFNIAFCDGSVHSISFFIDPTTHQHLCCRNDGAVIDQSKF
jgi:prepilin-type processing-associated H-X9-DG protein